MVPLFSNERADLEAVLKALGSVARDAPLNSDDAEREPEGLVGCGSDTVSEAQLIIEDAIFVEPFPGVPADPSDYELLHEYWPRVVGMVAAHTDTFSIHCWSWDEPGLHAARSVDGEIVGRVGDTIVLVGRVSGDWVSRVDRVCWGPGGELLWMNVVLYDNEKIALYSSHHGGDLRLWLPPDGAVTEHDVRRLLPEGVEVSRYHE